MAMLQRQTYINDIVNRLSGLASSVELRGLLNLLDLHVISEDFYVDLLNLIYGWKLRNANSLQQNAPGIDLVDDSNRILAQVTGTSTKGKIDHSLKEIPEKYTGYHFILCQLLSTQRSSESINTTHLMRLCLIRKQIFWIFISLRTK